MYGFCMPTIIHALTIYFSVGLTEVQTADVRGAVTVIATGTVRIIRILAINSLLNHRCQIRVATFHKMAPLV